MAHKSVKKSKPYEKDTMPVFSNQLKANNKLYLKGIFECRGDVNCNSSADKELLPRSQ